MKPKKYVSVDEALIKLQQYCAYQERCHEEVRTKLLSLGIYGDDLDQITTVLIEDDFLNEERFARAYARGKIRFNHWGRQRIKMELKARKISDYCLRKAMMEVEEDEYQGILEQVLSKRLADNPNRLAQMEAAQYAIRRGFESDLVFEIVKRLPTRKEE